MVVWWKAYIQYNWYTVLPVTIVDILGTLSSGDFACYEGQALLFFHKFDLKCAADTAKLIRHVLSHNVA